MTLEWRHGIWRILLVLFIVCFLYSRAIARKCPERCICHQDSKGRKTVSCDASKLGNAIPVFDMEGDTKVLIVSSVEEQPGTLTVGPIFSSLSDLEEVHITRANLPTIGENSFWGLRHLRLLNLTENNITLVLKTHLSGIKGLQHLHLDKNKISNIPSGTFQFLENLVTLTISENQLPGLTPRMFYLLSNLKTLDLSGNPIMDLDPEVLKDLPYLRVLRCSACVITRVKSHVYKALPNLEVVDLRDNFITSLAPDEYMDLRFLKFLYLDGNKIKILQDHTFRNRGLHYLGMSRNGLERISRFAFIDCSIMALDLSHNSFAYGSLKHTGPIIQHIHHLNISHNKISTDHLKEFLKRAPRLKTLNLSHMYVNQLPKDIFSHQDKVEKLNLSSNHLRFIPVDILHSLPSLKSLDLRHNEFRGFPEIVLRRLDRIKDLHLSHNPWSCDQCHIPHLKMWLNNSKSFRNACKPDIDAPNCLKCMGPREMYDKPIIEIDGLELQPCPEGSLDLAAASEGASEFSLLLAVVTALVVFFLLAIILVVGIIMYNRHSAFYYTHEDEPRHRFYDNPTLRSNDTDVTLEDDMDRMTDEECISETPGSTRQFSGVGSTETLRSKDESSSLFPPKDHSKKNNRKLTEIMAKKHKS